MSSATVSKRNRRSLMMYSALAAHRWHEVMNQGIDLVCFDLEDGTAPHRKDEARAMCLETFECAAHTRTSPDAEHLTGNLDAKHRTGALVRINAVRSAAGIRDLTALLAMTSPPDALVVPKVGCAQEVAIISDVLDDVGLGCELIALIEDQAGVRNCREIAAASKRISALFLGTVDLSGELGSDMGWDALYSARSRLVEAASEHGIDCIDGPWLDADDLDGLAAEATRLARMGFTGKASYDLGQLATIHNAFTPSAVEIAQAREIESAVADSRSGAARVRGRSVNRANAKAARRLLALAARRGVV